MEELRTVVQEPSRFPGVVAGAHGCVRPHVRLITSVKPGSDPLGIGVGMRRFHPPNVFRILLDDACYARWGQSAHTYSCVFDVLGREAADDSSINCRR